MGYSVKDIKIIKLEMEFDVAYFNRVCYQTLCATHSATVTKYFLRSNVATFTLVGQTSKVQILPMC